MPEYRQVLANLIARDLKVKYQSKALGFAWSLLAPAAMLAILYVIFNNAFRVTTPGYWAFLVAGLIPFQFMSESIVAGAQSIRGSAGLIRKIYMPMEILVVASLTVKAIEFLLQMLLVVLLLAALHHGGDDGHFHQLPAKLMPYVHDAPHFSLFKALVVLPGAILLSYLFVLGVALPLSAWCVIYKDLDHVITIVMRVLFYATPIFWGIFQFDGWWTRWAALNPIADFIALFRGPLYWGTWPFNEAVGGNSMTAWGLATAFAVGAFVIGYLLFNRSKRILAEVV